MKKSLLSVLAVGIFSVSAFAQSGNVGIGTNSPGTKLDVNGAITNRETAIAVSGNTASVPANVSQVQLTGSATAIIIVNVPSAQNAGQRLIIYNNTTGGFSATLNGAAIPMGKAMEFAYSNSGWQATNGGGITGDYDWMKSGNAFPNSPGDTAQNIYHISGNVGVGTNTPATNLHIVNKGTGGASVNATNATNIGLRLENTTNGQAIIEHIAAKDASGNTKEMVSGINPVVSQGMYVLTRPGFSDMLMDMSNGNVGLGGVIPTANLDVNGTARIRNTPIVTPGLGATVSVPVYRDVNGNIVTIAPPGHGNIMSGRLVTAPGVSTLIIGNIPDGTIHKLTVVVANGCTVTAVAEFWVIANSTGGSAMQGRDGFYSNGGTTGPTFTETQTSSAASFAAGTCVDGGNNSNLNFTVYIVNSGNGFFQINIVNNGNVNRDYSATLERVGAY